MKNRKIKFFSVWLITFLVVVIFYCANNAKAALLDTGVYPRPIGVPSFDINHKATDSVFNSTILRVTGPVDSNAYTTGAGKENMAPIQHVTIPWNSDGSKFLVWYDRMGSEGFSRVRAYNFNSGNFSIPEVGGYKDMPTLDGGAGGTGRAGLNINNYITWSKLNPKLMYGITVDTNTGGNYKIGSWNTDDDFITVLSQPDWMTLFSPAYDIEILMVSDDENTIGFMVTSANQVSKQYVVWMRDINDYAVIDMTTTTGGWAVNSKPSSAIMSRDGKYVKIVGRKTTEASNGNYIYLVSKIGNKVVIGEPTYYGSDAAGYYSAGKLSFWVHNAVNEDSSGVTGSSYALRHRDFDNFNAPTKIFGTNSNISTHPAYGPNGQWVAAGAWAYRSLATNLAASPPSYWDYDSGSIYFYHYSPATAPASVDYFMQNRVWFTKVNSKAEVNSANKFYYDFATANLYIYQSGVLVSSKAEINTAGKYYYDAVGKDLWVGVEEVIGYPTLSNYHSYGGVWGSYSDEILLIKTDGSQVRRLTQGWSNFLSNSYDELPSGVSPDNKYVLFYSNWGGSGRHDVFIVNTGLAAPIGYGALDFTALFTNWLQAGTISNLNSDSHVDAKDLGIMMSKWN